VHPRAVSARISLSRIGARPEIAGTALFLASEEVAYMTDTFVELDGGGS
jgi:NAD(P)-dependent dehydrogenase (short-subunit alcohol dehydrogenase family)